MLEILTAQKMIYYPKVALLWLSTNLAFILALNEGIKKKSPKLRCNNFKELRGPFLNKIWSFTFYVSSSSMVILQLNHSSNTVPPIPITWEKKVEQIFKENDQVAFREWCTACLVKTVCIEGPTWCGSISDIN